MVQVTWAVTWSRAVPRRSPVALSRTCESQDTGGCSPSAHQLQPLFTRVENTPQGDYRGVGAPPCPSLGISPGRKCWNDPGPAGTRETEIRTLRPPSETSQNIFV